MKKFLALVMAMMMVLAMGTVAFADETTTQTDMSSVNLVKVYKLAAADTVNPAENFAFGALTCTGVTNAGVIPETGAVVTAATAPVPTIANTADYIQGEATVAGVKKNVVINLPEYKAIGIYTYTFSETAGSTAGVAYNSGAITLVVTVIEQNGKVRVAAVHTEGEDEGKSDEFVNTYSAGSLEVSKTVTGQFGDTKKDFTVTVTFTAPAGKTVGAPIYYTDDAEAKTVAGGWNTTATAEITLKHGETVMFTNIPDGVTYSVSEADYTESDGYDEPAYAYSDAQGKVITGTETDKVGITNNKGAHIDTGISMDNAPYMMIMAMVVLAGAAMMMKRRAY